VTFLLLIVKHVLHLLVQLLSQFDIYICDIYIYIYIYICDAVMMDLQHRPTDQPGDHEDRCCAVTGQGAGVAAAVAALRGESMHALDMRPVQAELRRQGARIEGPDTARSKL
jgi:hypothetical protein